ncbi:hypothetical protein [Tengunoibacter tsumagoiensis]|uniref:hypothetical protein n=1 Tax=Tengunoibacter tsumagoiensis TaxID=2014871 RepID=UPI000F82E6B6|nr:hypothetical protein [Tengunoibacter tsumagoiensis]
MPAPPSPMVTLRDEGATRAELKRAPSQRFPASARTSKAQQKVSPLLTAPFPSAILRELSFPDNHSLKGAPVRKPPAVPR